MGLKEVKPIKKANKPSSLKKRLVKSAKKFARIQLFRILSHLPLGMKQRIFRRMLSLPLHCPDDLTVKIAETKEELEQAFALLHDCYVEVGAMPPQEHGMRVTPYHALPSTLIVVAKRQDKVIGTVSVIRDNPMGLPLESDFDISSLRKKHNLAEISALAVNNNYRGDSRTVAFSLFKYVYNYARYNFRTEAFVLSTAVRRKEFFQAVFLFKEIHTGRITNYDFAGGIPSVGMYVVFSEFDKDSKKIYGRMPKEKNIYSYMLAERDGGPQLSHLKYPARPEYEAFNSVMTPELMTYFFHKKTRLFQQLSEKEKMIITNSYPFPEYQEAVPEFEKFVSRQGPRRPRFDINGSVKIMDLENNRILTGQALDVSLTGIRLKPTGSSQQLPQKCRLHVDLGPDFPRLSVEASLVWNGDGSCGYVINKSDRLWSNFASKLEAKFRKASRRNVA